MAGRTPSLQSAVDGSPAPPRWSGVAANPLTEGLVASLTDVVRTPPNSHHYRGLDQAFVHQVTLNVRRDLHGTGVRLTCIEPRMSGGTDFSAVRFNGDKRQAAATYAAWSR